MSPVPNTGDMSSAVQFIAAFAQAGAESDATEDAPGRIPPEAMLLVDSAAGIAERLAARDRQVQFTPYGAEVRTLDGTVLRRLSLVDAIDVMCGLVDVD